MIPAAHVNKFCYYVILRQRHKPSQKLKNLKCPVTTKKLNRMSQNVPSESPELETPCFKIW